jgi:TRAP-type C4-dicarboxylate transport system permease large subunit
MKGVCPGASSSDLYRAAAPFLLSDSASITLVILFPQLALWLPNLFMR